MRRYVVECDICGEEIHEYYEIKMKYVSFCRAGRTTRRHDRIICWDCKETLAKMVRNERKRTKT